MDQVFQILIDSGTNSGDNPIVTLKKDSDLDKVFDAFVQAVTLSQENEKYNDEWYEYIGDLLQPYDEHDAVLYQSYLHDIGSSSDSDDVFGLLQTDDEDESPFLFAVSDYLANAVSFVLEKDMAEVKETFRKDLIRFLEDSENLDGRTSSSSDISVELKAAFPTLFRHIAEVTPRFYQTMVEIGLVEDLTGTHHGFNKMREATISKADSVLFVD